MDRLNSEPDLRLLRDGKAATMAEAMADQLWIDAWVAPPRDVGVFMTGPVFREPVVVPRWMRYELEW